MNKLKKILFVLTFAITFFLLNQFVLAEEPEINNQSTEEQNTEKKKTEEKSAANQSTNEDEIFTKTYGDYKDQKVYYNIDYVDLSEVEESGFFDKFKVFSNVKDGAVGVIYNLMHEVFVAFPFFALKILTASLIFLLNMVYEVNFVNSIVDEVAPYIQSVAGITGMNFGSTGLFGGFLGIITLTVSLYTAYQIMIKKASITAFSGLFKSLTALVLALVFFSNYGAIIKGLNTLSVETASLILSGGATVTNGVIDDKNARARMTEGVWNTFVHHPYLMLQYGTMDEQAIGSDRIETLLKTKTDTEERYNIVTEEIKKGNELMTRGKIFERLGILLISIFAGILNSIPVLILTFALLFFQFWFTAMAMIAPFVFIWSAFPNQFKVLGRYIVELITPLVLKLGVALLALIVFTLTTVLSNISMNVIDNGSILGYVFLMFTEGILLFTLFLLRKRIMNIFSLGSQELRFLRQEMSKAFVQPAKKSIQTTATIGGAAVGAMVGGAQGAMMGANIGSSIGNTVTGKQDVSDTVKHVTLTSMLAENKGSSDLTNQEEPTNSKKVGTSSTPSSSEKIAAEESELINLEEVENETTTQSKPDTATSESAPIVTDDKTTTPLEDIDGTEQSQQPIPRHSNLDEINPVDENFELNEVIDHLEQFDKIIDEFADK